MRTKILSAILFLQILSASGACAKEVDDDVKSEKRICEQTAQALQRNFKAVDQIRPPHLSKAIAVLQKNELILKKLELKSDDGKQWKTIQLNKTYARLGECYDAEGNYKSAINAFEQSNDLLRAIAECEKAGDYHSAEILCRQAMKDARYSAADLQPTLSDILKHQRVVEKTEPEMLASLEKELKAKEWKKVRATRTALIKLYERDGRFDDAKPVYMALESKVCPDCKSDSDVVPILFGLESKESGKTYHNGGCMMSKDSPKWYCNRDSISF